jgi:hypothetical protein
VQVQGIHVVCCFFYHMLAELHDQQHSLHQAASPSTILPKHLHNIDPTIHVILLHLQWLPDL